VTEIEADKPIGVSCNESVGHCISEPYICSLCDVVGHYFTFSVIENSTLSADIHLYEGRGRRCWWYKG